MVRLGRAPEPPAFFDFQLRLRQLSLARVRGSFAAIPARIERLAIARLLVSKAHA
jgi:hypothetical protein